MSRQAFILNPVDRVERFSIPVATKDFFLRVWGGCKEHGLQWIPIFSTGIDILKEDVTVIEVELDKFKR